MRTVSRSWRRSLLALSVISWVLMAFAAECAAMSCLKSVVWMRRQHSPSRVGEASGFGLGVRRRRAILQKVLSQHPFFPEHTSHSIDDSSCMKPFLRLSYRAARSNHPRLSTCFIHKKSVLFTQTRSYTARAVEQDEMPKDKEKTNFQLKVPKGTKDWEGRDMVIRDKIFGSITEVFKRHGAVTIDTLVNPSMGAGKRGC